MEAKALLIIKPQLQPRQVMEMETQVLKKNVLNIALMLLTMINVYAGTDTNSMDKNVFKLLEPAILMEQALQLEVLLILQAIQILEQQKRVLHIVHMLLMMINAFA